MPHSSETSSAPRKPIAKASYEALASFRHALRQFLHFSETAAAQAGLSPQQHQALLAIKGFPGRERVTVGELAEQLLIRPHSAVGLVDRLVAEGFVERQASEEDRRRVFVALTARGTEVLETLSTSHRQELRRVRPILRAVLDQVAQD